MVVGYAVQGPATACTRITRGAATLNRAEISVNGVNARLESSLISFFFPLSLSLYLYLGILCQRTLFTVFFLLFSLFPPVRYSSPVHVRQTSFDGCRCRRRLCTPTRSSHACVSPRCHGINNYN